MRGSSVAGVVALAVGGFMLADVLTHPTGTRAAGGTITALWRRTAQGVTGQKIA